MEEFYIQELEIHIMSKNIKEASYIIEMLKLDKYDTKKYEEQLELIINNNSKKTIDKTVDKMNKSSERLKYAKEMVKDMESQGENILNMLNDNKEKIKSIQNNVNNIDDKISYANKITKRMLSFTRNF